MLSDIKHVFVLMLENRSFDHMLGAIPLPGVDLVGAPTAAEGIGAGAFSNQDDHGTVYSNSVPAPAVMPVDPPHEYDDVVLQLLGGKTDPPFNYNVTPISNSGFIKSYAQAGPNPLGAIVSSFTAADIPYLAQLAKEYCVCDNWYSSLPGPTVPNRFFLIAGSSLGNPKTPPDLRMLGGEFLDKFSFPNGNIFKRIKERTKLTLRIYRGDSLPFSELIDGVDYIHDTVPFDRARFAADCNAANLPAFVFIEPSYGVFDGYQSGNSQHPRGNVRAGDQLIKDIYDGISGSACWPNSLFIITYDEHGGFFDHKVPPKAVAPGDAHDVYDFHFTQLGVRVPAVIISPLLVRRNLVDHTVYDHTSILATLRDIFPQLGQLGPFTMRDRMAASLAPLFSGPAASLTPTALPSVGLRVNAPEPQLVVSDDAEPLEHAEISGLRIAGSLHHRLGRVPKSKVLAEISAIKTKGEARAYFRRIDVLVQAKTARPARPSRPSRANPKRRAKH